MSQNRIPLRRSTVALLRAASWGGNLSALALWPIVERLAMRVWRVRPVEEGSVLQFGISPFRGPATVLGDGTPVPKGARILHLHLANRRVGELVRAAHGNPWAIAPGLNADLKTLGRLTSSGSLGAVIALRGITVHAAMARRFGFEVRPLPRNLRWALIRELGVLVVASYTVDPAAIARGVPWPGEIWMSVGALRNRMGSNQGDP